MNKNIDLENSSYADIKSILSKLTWKSWALLFGGFSVVITTLIAVGFIDFPWVSSLKNKENNSFRVLDAKYGATKVFLKGGYLHVGSSTVQSCIDDYKKSFNEVGAEVDNKLPSSFGYSPGLIVATLNGHDIYAYCYTTASNKINSHVVLFAEGYGDTNILAQKAANLAGVNLDSVISHLKGVQPL
jgi:hypothetical protein